MHTHTHTPLLIFGTHLVYHYPSLSGVVHADRVEPPELVVAPLAPHIARRLCRLNPLERVPLVMDSDWPETHPLEDKQATQDTLKGAHAQLEGHVVQHHDESE